MPRYDYQCRRCGVIERNVPYEQRDVQVCICGRRLRRLPHYSSTQTNIPESFRAQGGGVPAGFAGPQNEHERRVWDNDGVGSTRWV